MPGLRFFSDQAGAEDDVRFRRDAQAPLPEWPQGTRVRWLRATLLV